MHKALLGSALYFGLGISSILALTNCSVFKGSEAPDAHFLSSPEKMAEHRERFPFQKVWLKDFSENFFSDYTEVLIAPVDVDHLLAHDWVADMSLRGKTKIHQDAKMIAEYMQEKFKETIRNDKNGRFTLVDTASPQTLVVELALVELVPTKAWLNVSGNIIGLFLPGASILTSLASSGSVAIEGRFRDGGTGEIVAMFKDRESDQIAPIGIQDLTWYKHAEDEIDDWARQFVEVLDTKADHKVADSTPLTFRIW